MSALVVMACEWCERPASFRIKAGVYARFACDNQSHRAKVKQLVNLDIGDARRESMTNPTGFSPQGRALRHV